MFEEMHEPERIEAFAALAGKYCHRIALPLSKDTFGLEAHLRDNATDFARVAFQSIDTAYYLSNDLEAVKRLFNFLPPGLDLDGYRNPWDNPHFLAKAELVGLSMVRTEFEAECAEADDQATRGMKRYI